ncbi:MAG TPA: dual specificity protein phosphatase family protein [Bryobacteraceae bacterium]|jgi:protein-tyrosine phosphatase|nr:dual specificity protein phosphatase family protein [Bryobacteraceae bacterium]
MKADLYWVPGPWPGRLAISKRPRGGEWLADEVKAWKAVGVSTVVSLLEEDESAELGLAREAETAGAAGIEFISLPVPDRGVPGSAEGMARVVARLHAALQRGDTVAVHCRQGIGRSGMLAAGTLIAAGLEARQAMEVVSRARGVEVPETDEQREWLTEALAGRVAVGTN